MLINSNNTRLVQNSICLLLLSTLIGCSSNMGELEDYVEDVKNSPPGEVSEPPEIKTYATFVYPGHERDPFDTNVLAAEIIVTPEGVVKPKVSKSTIPAPDQNRVKEYLEGYPLDSLGMVGTLNQNNELWALIQTSDGTIQRVAQGNYMGKNYGKITSITESEIKLTEKVSDRIGGFIERQATIALPEK